MQHADHVVSAVPARMAAMRSRVRILLVTHLDATVAFGIRIPHLVLTIRFALEGLLSVVLRRQVKPRVSHERVAHDKDIVRPLRPTRNEIRAIGRFPTIGGLSSVHGSLSHLYPYELPIKVKVVNKRFAAFECLVL